MKRSDVKEIVVGGVTITMFGLLLLLFQSGQYQRAQSGINDYRIFATFNRIDGLEIGADVMVSGIQVGRVESMKLDLNYRARVGLLIGRAVGLPRDTAAAIHTDGIFGSKFVTLDPGGEQENLKDGDTISFTQDAIIVGELLDLVIAEGKASRKHPKIEGEGKGG